MTLQSTTSNLEKQIKRQKHEHPQPKFLLQDYLLLLKPRVMSLVVFTGVVGLLLSPHTVDLKTAFVAITCIALGAGASGAINMWYDKDIDHVMTRTMNRPIPAGRMSPNGALFFGTSLAFLSVGIMGFWVNIEAATLLAITILYYVFVYTMWLKRRTPQNIVIGGAAGAFPPMIGWVAASGDIGLGSIVLFGIIFLWTPPHSWALALFRRSDYEAAGIPMLPVVAGETETKRQMCVYTLLLIPTTLMPAFLGMSGMLYTAAAIVLGVEFGRRTWVLWRDTGIFGAKPLFFYSILYLFLIFAMLIIDKAFFFPFL